MFPGSLVCKSRHSLDFALTSGHSPLQKEELDHIDAGHDAEMLAIVLK